MDSPEGYVGAGNGHLDAPNGEISSREASVFSPKEPFRTRGRPAYTTIAVTTSRYPLFPSRTTIPPAIFCGTGFPRRR